MNEWAHKRSDIQGDLEKIALKDCRCRISILHQSATSFLSRTRPRMHFHASLTIHREAKVSSFLLQFT